LQGTAGRSRRLRTRHHRSECTSSTPKRATSNSGTGLAGPSSQRTKPEHRHWHRDKNLTERKTSVGLALEGFPHQPPHPALAVVRRAQQQAVAEAVYHLHLVHPAWTHPLQPRSSVVLQTLVSKTKAVEE
jgi:hypothetical protein